MNFYRKVSSSVNVIFNVKLQACHQGEDCVHIVIHQILSCQLRSFLQDRGERICVDGCGKQVALSTVNVCCFRSKFKSHSPVTELCKVHG